MFQRVLPFLFFLPCPAAKRPQSRCEKLFSFTRHLSRLHCSALHRRSLPSCDTADISARQSPQTPLLFRTEDSPCVLPVCKHLRTVLIVRVALFLAPGQADRTETLSRLCAHSCSPPPCRCYVLGWLLAAVILHTTIHRTFNHTRCICSILT